MSVPKWWRRQWQRCQCHISRSDLISKKIPNAMQMTLSTTTESVSERRHWRGQRCQYHAGDTVDDAGADVASRHYRWHRIQCQANTSDDDNSVGVTLITLAKTPMLMPRWWHWQWLRCRFQVENTNDGNGVSVTMMTLATTSMSILRWWNLRRHRCQCHNEHTEDGINDNLTLMKATMMTIQIEWKRGTYQRRHK